MHTDKHRTQSSAQTDKRANILRLYYGVVALRLRVVVLGERR